MVQRTDLVMAAGERHEGRSGRRQARGEMSVFLGHLWVQSSTGTGQASGGSRDPSGPYFRLQEREQQTDWSGEDVRMSTSAGVVTGTRDSAGALRRSPGNVQEEEDGPRARGPHRCNDEGNGGRVGHTWGREGLGKNRRNGSRRGALRQRTKSQTEDGHLALETLSSLLKE